LKDFEVALEAFGMRPDRMDARFAAISYIYFNTSNSLSHVYGLGVFSTRAREA
jgi:hypothetical protein